MKKRVKEQKRGQRETAEIEKKRGESNRRGKGKAKKERVSLPAPRDGSAAGRTRMSRIEKIREWVELSGGERSHLPFLPLLAPPAPSPPPTTRPVHSLGSHEPEMLTPYPRAHCVPVLGPQPRLWLPSSRLPFSKCIRNEPASLGAVIRILVQVLFLLEVVAVVLTEGRSTQWHWGAAWTCRGEGSFGEWEAISRPFWDGVEVSIIQRDDPYKGSNRKDWNHGIQCDSLLYSLRHSHSLRSPCLSSVVQFSALLLSHISVSSLLAVRPCAIHLSTPTFYSAVYLRGLVFCICFDFFY